MNWIKDISKAQQAPKFSQYGEEWYIKEIFKNIGETNKCFIDIGAMDGVKFSNTKLLSDSGWKGLLIDGKEFPGVQKHFVTQENILAFLKKNRVPIEPDLLSLDIDGNDYWILKKVLSKYKPRLIVSEFNSEVTGSKTINYNPEFKFWPCEYYGYTFDAGVKLAEEFGYTVIFQNSCLNMYYLRNDLAGGIGHIANPGIHKWWGRPTNMKIKEDWVKI